MIYSNFWLYHAPLKEILLILLCGFLGGLAKDLAKGYFLSLPKIVEGQLYLGTIGSMLLGAIIAFIVDNNPVTAFSSALAAPYIIEEMLSTIKDKKSKNRGDENRE